MSKVDLTFTSFEDIKKVAKSNIPMFLIILALSVLVYANGMGGEFVSDDLPGIVNNPVVHSVGLAIKNLSFQHFVWSLIYASFGANPTPFHILSLTLHIINVCLFFLIVYNLFNKKVAAIASVLYAVHPLASETLLWISAVNYLWCTLFLYSSVLLYLLFKKTGEKKYFIAILVLFALLTLFFSNFWILMIPFFLAGLDFFLLQKDNNLKFLIRLAPLFGLSLVAFIYFGYFRSGIQVGERINSLATPDATPFINRLPYSFYMPAEQLIFPKDLTLYHEGEKISSFKFQAMTYVVIAFFIILFYLWTKPKNRTVVGLIALIYLSLLPVFSPLQVAWFTAERYDYVAVGLFSILLALLFLKLDRKTSVKSLAIILTVILLIIYSVRTVIRTNDWKTRKSVWLATAKVSPYSPRVHNNLGDVYGTERDWQKSVAHFQLAIKLKPNYAEAMHNLGNTYMIMGQLDQAKEWLLKSVQANPNLYQSYHKLGLIAYNQGDPEAAKKYFEQALQINPNYLPAIQALQALQQKTQ
jgi:hypothetical protein